MEASELEQLTKPEARPTTAFDASELQGLIEESRRADDDLAIPVEPSPPRVARGSARTPKAQRPLTKPRVPLLPWILVAISAVVVIVLAIVR